MYTIHGLFGLVSAELLLMEEIMHQLSLAVYPIICRLLYTSLVVVWDF